MSEVRADGTGAGPAGERRVVWWVLFGLVIAWSTYLYFAGPRAGTGDLAAPRLGAPMPPRRADYRWTLAGLDGRPVELGRYRGKALFLNVWATWCPPCVAEMPSIDGLAANPRLKDVAFVCVAADDAESVRRFVERRKLKVPVLVAADPPPEPFDSEAIPATFIIAPDGTIVAEEVGASRWDDPSVVDLLESLARSAAPPPRHGEGGDPAR